MARTLPRPSALSQPYWDGCREGLLRLQRCDDCEKFQFYPRVFCSHCGAAKLSWHTASGRGRIASFTVVRKGISAAYQAPYIVALIDLEEGPRMMSSLVDIAPANVRTGCLVEVTFADWSADISVPVFRPANNPAGVFP